MKKFLIIPFILLSNLISAQIVVLHFNAGWNEANSVVWVDDLEDCEIEHIDIAKKVNLQKKWNVVVVPTILILQYDEEKKRYQADISFHMSATREEVQEKIDEIIMSGF